jgi:hypothetical protein
VGGGVQARAAAGEIGVPALAAVGLVTADDQIGRGVAVDVARGEVGRRLVGEDGRLQCLAAAVAAVPQDREHADVLVGTEILAVGADREVVKASTVARTNTA